MKWFYTNDMQIISTWVDCCDETLEESVYLRCCLTVNLLRIYFVKFVVFESLPPLYLIVSVAKRRFSEVTFYL